MSATLLLSEIFPPQHGGSGRWFWEIYRRLADRGVVVAAGQYPGYEAFDASHGLDVERLRLSMPEWGIRSVRGLRDYVRLFRKIRHLAASRGVTAIHAGRCLPEGWLAWLLHRWTGLPYLCYVHGEDVQSAAQSREQSWMVRRVFSSARCVVANSHNTRRILLDRWGQPAEKVHVLHPGVDIDKFRPADSDADIRRQLGWEGRNVVLTVGRLQKRKGHDHMIRALPAIRVAVPDVLYCIVGDGEERRALEALVRELQVEPYVQFRSETADEELVRCYQQCDLFALPNREVNGDIEGFGMVLLEAQACGKPVLAGDSGGTAETMKPRETGRIVNCEQPEPLADAVAELLSSPVVLAHMGAAACEWSRRHFGWDALAIRAADTFAELDGGVTSRENMAAATH